MSDTQLIVGSDSRVEIKSEAIWAGRRIDQGPVDYGWSGEVHAVPVGTQRALCGSTVRYVFEDSPWPAGMADAWCRECSRLAGDDD